MRSSMALMASQFVARAGHIQAARQTLHSDALRGLNNAVHGRQGPSAEPVTEQRRDTNQQREDLFFDQPEMIQSLIERFGGHCRMDLKNLAAGLDALQRRAILHLLQIVREKRNLRALRRRQRRDGLQETRRAKNPVPAGVRHLKNRAVGPQFR